MNPLGTLTARLQALSSREKALVAAWPGMGFISASTILAEIGDFRDFSSANKLAAYCGLVPSVYQSAGKLITGHITKHGSPHIRRILIEVAHAIILTKKLSKLKKFFLRVKARRGAKIGLVALARKVLCILYHLLVSRELYQDDLLGKPRCIKNPRLHPKTAMDLDEMIRTIIKAGYEVRKNECLESG